MNRVSTVVADAILVFVTWKFLPISALAAKNVMSLTSVMLRNGTSRGPWPWAFAQDVAASNRYTVLHVSGVRLLRPRRLLTYPCPDDVAKRVDDAERGAARPHRKLSSKFSGFLSSSGH